MGGMRRKRPFWRGMAGAAWVALAILTAGAVLTAGAPAARAQTAQETVLELKLGLLAHDAGLFSSPKEPGVDIHGQLVFQSFAFLKRLAGARPHLGFNAATNGISQVFAGLTWDTVFGAQERFYLLGELGGAIHNADPLDPPSGRERDGQRYLGCRALFRLAAGLGYRITDQVSIEFYADHISNATLCSNNEGLENAGVRLGYRF